MQGNTNSQPKTWLRRISLSLSVDFCKLRRGATTHKLAERFLETYAHYEEDTPAPQTYSMI